MARGSVPHTKGSINASLKPFWKCPLKPNKSDWVKDNQVSHLWKGNSLMRGWHPCPCLSIRRHWLGSLQEPQPRSPLPPPGSFEPGVWDRNIFYFFLRALALRPKALIKQGTTVALLALSLELKNLGILGLLDHFLSQQTWSLVPRISCWNSTGTHFFRAIRCFVAVHSASTS